MTKGSSSLASGEGTPARRTVVGGRTVLALASALAFGLVPAASGGIQHNPDVDGDGLGNAQELVLGSSPNHSDTDRDGFSDLEEIARHSSPLSKESVPNPNARVSVGLTAHAQTDGVHVLAGVFMSDMDLRSKQVEIGVYGHGQLIRFSNAYLAAHASISYHPATIQSGCIALIDLRLDPAIVHAAGHLTVWAKARQIGAAGATSADSLHLLSIAGLVVYAMPTPPTLAQSMQKQDNSANVTGSIYVPLLPGQGGGGGGGGNGSGSGSGSVPATWEPGQVCFQRAAPVGADGVSVTNEVVHAECVPGWDGFCPPTCTSSVGSTYRTVDPLTLIGG